MTRQAAPPCLPRASLTGGGRPVFPREYDIYREFIPIIRQRYILTAYKRINRFIKFILLLLMFCVMTGGVGAQQANRDRHWWFTLETGKKLFRQGAYGDALIAFHDARNERRELYSKMEHDLIILLSLTPVRRMNDSLELIEQYIAERGQIDAAEALDEIYYRVGRAELRNSARAALEYLDRLKSYPEADYWIGETYRLMGENKIALRQFNEALAAGDRLENPAFTVAIRYKIADIERISQRYGEMERQLLMILERDTLWAQDGGSFVREAMSRTLKNSGINRFLQMYRHKNAETEQAHRLLGLYFYDSGQYANALPHLVFAFLIQSTTIIDEIIAKQFDFRFTNLEDMMQAIARRAEIQDYIREIDFYKTAYHLAGALYALGDTVPARELWTFVSSRGEAGEWRERARSQLRSNA
jgi:tetratricopeptide (TPR) repeat protein